jgi:hypothetical protein
MDSGMVRPPIPAESIEVFRTGPPADPIKDLGTITVTCPTYDVVEVGDERAAGGCTYGRALQLARTKASESGANGIHSIETAVNTRGAVVTLRASTFYYLPKPKPATPPPATDEAVDEAVDARLKRLEDLKAKQLITPGSTRRSAPRS